ncbi:tripartite tricarboxylate transporter TctB family protein [Rothia nasisuis]|uniref:tripartite tricarboxylate transporter TctB family protein n=1 Tax=Rothia nasisuis TaxID=2109647 RepID=UPI001F4266AB|nr:tripartite tricarboxylate transporter TctB family protein [Rothia nasisuis]
MSAPALPSAPHPVNLGRELLMPAILLALAAYLGYGMLTMDVPDSVTFPGPRFFPLIITLGLVVLTLVDIADIFRRASLYKRQVAASAAETELAYTAPIMVTAPEPTKALDHRSLAWVTLGFLFFALTLPYTGWVIGAGLLFWCVARGFGATRPLFSLVVGLTVSSFAYIMFDMVLGLSLPSGLLGGSF